MYIYSNAHTHCPTGPGGTPASQWCGAVQPPSRGDVGGVHGGRAQRRARGAQHRATGGVA